MSCGWAATCGLLRGDAPGRGAGALGLALDPSDPYLTGASYIKPVYEFAQRIYHVHFDTDAEDHSVTQLEFEHGGRTICA